MRAVASWMIGMGGVQAGAALTRLLVALLPKPVALRDPPLWAAGLLAASALAHIGAGRRLLSEPDGWAARGFVGVAIPTWLLLTLVSLNTSTIDPGALEAGSVGALAATWRGAGWAGMLAWADAFTWVPTGMWTTTELLLAGLSLALGLTLLARLLRRDRSTGEPALGAPSGREPMASRAPRRGMPEAGSGRALGAAVALHLAVLIFLTIAVLVGLSFRVAGMPFV